jgi:hypothetical protein
MKTILRLAMVAAFIAAASPKVFAESPPLNLPDGGSSAILVAMGAAGLVAARRMFGKK